MVYNLPSPPFGRESRQSPGNCIDEMFFDKTGAIMPVKINKEGVKPTLLK